MTKEILRDCMTTAEAAEYLGYNSDSVCNLCINGKLSGAFKFGKAWAIPKQSVYNYEKGPQGFAVGKTRKEAEKKTWLDMLNTAIREGAARRTVQSLATA